MEKEKKILTHITILIEKKKKPLKANCAVFRVFCLGLGGSKHLVVM